MNKAATIIFIISLLISSCDCNTPKIHIPLNTMSIVKSKEFGNFLHSYKAMNIKLNDTIEFNIKQVWCEKTYYYDDIDEKGKFKEKTKNHYSIVMVLDKNLEEMYSGFGDTWRFVDMSTYNSKGVYCLSSYKGDLSSYSPLPDTLEIKLEYYTPPDNPNEFWKTNNLGSFYLYKEN